MKGKNKIQEKHIKTDFYLPQITEGRVINGTKTRCTLQRLALSFATQIAVVVVVVIYVFVIVALLVAGNGTSLQPCYAVMRPPAAIKLAIKH